jgi:GNAT superfamily N-acetyltransferase
VTFSIQTSTSLHRADITALVTEMMPNVDAEARLAWLYARNPAGRALTWLAYENAELVGCTSYFPFRLQLDGEVVLGALGGDGYVRPAFRRRGVATLLHATARHAMSLHGISCMYGAPATPNVTPLIDGGSRETGSIVRWTRPLRGAAFRAHALDGVIRDILRPRSVACLDPMSRADARVDAIWRTAASTIRLATVRDSAFYTWRFIDAPAHKQQPFVILRRGRAIGACALVMVNGGKTMRIVDLFTMDDCWHDALAAIADHAAETDALTLDIKLSAVDGRRRSMWRSAFIEREAKRFLVAIPKHGNPRFLDPMRWFYGGADSDLDTLESPAPHDACDVNASRRQRRVRHEIPIAVAVSSSG